MQYINDIELDDDENVINIYGDDVSKINELIQKSYLSVPRSAVRALKGQVTFLLPDPNVC